MNFFMKLKQKPTEKSVYEDAMSLLQQIDETLVVMKDEWKNEKDTSEKRMWMGRMDMLLDERVRVMKVRDNRKP